MYWIKEITLLGALALTMQAQALSIDDIDPAKELIHPVFFPTVQANSTEIEEIFAIDKRYTADRREWEQRGRFIPQDEPKTTRTTLVPIESFDKIGELEQQKIMERVGANQQMFRDIIGTSIPARVNKLVAANYRRVEVDALEAWAKGQITVMNPATGGTHVTSLGFAASRYVTAATAWDDAGVNAYSLLTSFIETAESKMGVIKGVMLSRKLFQVIQADAPNPIPGITQTALVTRTDLEQLVSRSIGHDFKFFINEKNTDLFDGAGKAVTRTRIWPHDRIAAVPAQTVVGATYRAPVLRAMDLIQGASGKGVDTNGMMIYHEFENNGRSLTIECQANWLPLPSERWVYVENTGITA